MARVTVVNDQPDFLGVMREVLETLGHHCEALPADSVDLDGIAATRPDLLIVDLRMDTGALNDGWGLILAARSHPELKDIPIIISTADHEFLRTRMEEIGALADVHPLPKPFGVDDVEELIDRLVERNGIGGQA